MNNWCIDRNALLVQPHGDSTRLQVVFVGAGGGGVLVEGQRRLDADVDEQVRRAAPNVEGLARLGELRREWLEVGRRMTLTAATLRRLDGAREETILRAAPGWSEKLVAIENEIAGHDEQMRTLESRREAMAGPLADARAAVEARLVALRWDAADRAGLAVRDHVDHLLGELAGPLADLVADLAVSVAAMNDYFFRAGSRNMPGVAMRPPGPPFDVDELADAAARAAVEGNEAPAAPPATNGRGRRVAVPID